MDKVLKPLGLVLLCSTKCHFLFYNIKSLGKRGCFTYIVCLVSCDCQCSVSLPHGAVGWSAVCDCDNVLGQTHELFSVYW